VNKTKIDWCDYSVNPITGKCPHGCWYCYAEKIRKRFGLSEMLAYNPDRLLKADKIKKPSRIFVGSMIDIFANEIPSGWIQDIISTCYTISRHIYIFLTKNPHRYNEFDFPENCWLGVTITWGERRDIILRRLKRNNIKFISFEPLVADVGFIDLEGIDWVIIGAMTGRGKKYLPKVKWIKKILKQADELKIPVFMKENLKTVWKKELIQNFPIKVKEE